MAEHDEGEMDAYEQFYLESDESSTESVRRETLQKEQQTEYYLRSLPQESLPKLKALQGTRLIREKGGEQVEFNASKRQR